MKCTVTGFNLMVTDEEKFLVNKDFKYVCVGSDYIGNGCMNTAGSGNTPGEAVANWFDNRTSDSRIEFMKAVEKARSKTEEKK